MSIDTSPKRLRELAGSYHNFKYSKELYEALLALAEEKENPGPVCPTCGSDCNERDELIKAEREIERQRGEKEPHPSPADERARGWDECMSLWADHMKRMNDALAKPLPEGWANHAHHIERNVRDALDAAPADAQLPPLTFEVTVIDDEHPSGIPLERWVKPADVPLPEPYARQTVGGPLFGHKPVEEDLPLYDKEQMLQYGQACAKAARDAAFDECARICLGVYNCHGGFPEAARYCADDIQAAKKGAT